MLTITIPGTELWDERSERFLTVQEETVTLEHSLVSISKWESKWHKAFLRKQKKTDEETRDYVRCMSVYDDVSPNILIGLTDENISQINAYIEDSMTATYISDIHKGAGTNRDTVTSELIYYWMIALNIPFECQYWHLNRLMTLINVCSIKNQPAKKMGRNELMRRNTALNAARRKQMHTKGGATHENNLYA